MIKPGQDLLPRHTPTAHSERTWNDSRDSEPYLNVDLKEGNIVQPAVCCVVKSVMVLKFRALYPFQGDPFAGLLGFEAGTVLAVADPGRAGANGWAYGHCENDIRNQGWFPLTYVEKIAGDGTSPAGGPAAATLTPIAPAKNAFPDLLGEAKLSTAPVDTVTDLLEKSALNDDDGGFGGTPMGGEWTGSGNNTGSAGWLPASTTNGAPDPPCVHRHSNNPDGSGGRARSRPLRGIGSAVSHAASRTGNAVANAASRTGSALSSAATKTGATTKRAVHEAGHRYFDMEDQRQAKMQQNAVKHTSEPAASSGAAGQVTTTTREATVASGGILPGRRTERMIATETSNGGVSKTTVTERSRPSGGFMPWIPGRTETTQTVTRGPSGEAEVRTETRSGGGFYVIPLGPIGLAACGAMAAKNAYDHHREKQDDGKGVPE